MASEEVVVQLGPSDLRGYRCPQCHGAGHFMNGSMSLNTETGEFRYKPPTKCFLCLGRGRVKCVPLDDLPEDVLNQKGGMP